MKFALVIPDGAADEPQQELGGRTPLEAASLPHCDAVAAAGVVGTAEHVPAEFPSGSDVGTMSLFGYDPRKYHTGRAPLEAAAQGIQLGPSDWAIRCNLVTVEKGRMKSFTAGQIPSSQAARLMNELAEAFRHEQQWEFYAGVSYRNLVVRRVKEGEASPFDRTTRTVPPHDILDQPVEEFQPQGPGAEWLRHVMAESERVFARSEVNRQRKKDGELPATGVWLWGLGQRPALEPFHERFGVRGAVITAVDLLRGIARLLGWEIIEVPGATGYLDTDYAAKGRAAVEALKRFDLVVVHVEATDEASHEGNAQAKVHALEQIDRHIVGPLHKALKSYGAYRLLICPDHPTFLRTRTHAHGPVPWAVCGSDVPPCGAEHYDDPTASRSSLKLNAGHELMPRFLTNRLT